MKKKCGPSLINEVLLPKEDILYSHRFVPTTSAQLAVHTKKLTELKTWLQEKCVARPNGGILLLTGPAGTGKSTSVCVLCRELGIEVISYEAERLQDAQLQNATACDIDSLRDFIQNAARSFSCKGRRKLLLIEFIPDTVYQDPTKFRDFMKRIFSSLSVPIVFCISDTESNWSISHRRVFTANFVQDYKISTLCFNAIAATFMKKALSRAMNDMGVKASESSIKRVIDSARGDVRNAMNILHLTASEANTEFAMFSCNHEDMFHMLGRILHAKRVKLEDGIGCRPPLEKDVNETVEMSNTSPATLLAFIHEHEPNFSNEISTLRAVFNDLSLCDAFGSVWEGRQRFHTSYFSQIVARSTTYYNYRAEKKPHPFVLSKPKILDHSKEVDFLFSELRKGSLIGDSQMGPLTVPYSSFILRDAPLPLLFEYLTRPYHINWQKGLDDFSRSMNNNVKNRAKKRKAEDLENDEKFCDEFSIEDSDEYDSFDEE